MAQMAYLAAYQAMLIYKHDILMANLLALLAIYYLYTLRKVLF